MLEKFEYFTVKRFLFFPPQETHLNTVKEYKVDI